MIRLFARHPTAANLLMLVLIALGIIGAGRLQRETFPDFAANELEIRVPYPGASAEEVEEGINQRIEDALDGVRFVKEVRSNAREGIGIVTVEMEKVGKFMTFKDDVRTEIDAINDFPTEAEDAVIVELGITDPVISLLVTGPMRPADLKAYCEKLKDRLQVEPGITLVKIRGFSDHQFRIELSRAALMRHGLSASEVADTVARQSLNLPAGSIETRERDILLRFVEERRSIRELEEIIVVANSGAGELRLGDIGKVIDTFETAEDKIQLGQRRAGLLVVEKNKNQDLIRIADTVAEERLPGACAGLPHNVAVLQRPPVFLGGGQSADLFPWGLLCPADDGHDDQHAHHGRAADRLGTADGRRHCDRRKRGHPPGQG